MQTDRSSQVTIVVGSGNLHKVEEIAAALSDLSDRESRSIRVESIRSLPEGSKPEETGSTFEENALLKARAYAGLALGLPPGRRPRWILADDSGLSVDALRGAPGVLSARYAGEGATDEENNQKLLHALRGVPAGQRGAEFVCVLSLVRVDDLLMCDPLLGDLSRGPAEQAFSVEGRCRGEILPTHQGKGGFGYDPLFFVPELGKSFAQLTTEEKNTHSHRGRALQRLRTGLGEILKRFPEDP